MLCHAADPDPRLWRGVNLLALFRSPGDSTDSRAKGYFNEDHFRWLNEWGFNFVRLPMDYRHFLCTNDWSVLRSEGFAKVDQAVEFGRKYGIHIQLCLHRAPGYTVLEWDPEPCRLQDEVSAQQAFCRLWKAFADRYRGISSEHLSFNLLNEPAHFTSEQYVSVFKSALRAIREIDADRFVILDGNDTASIPVREFYAEPHTGQAFRGYVPHAVSHYGAWYIKPQPMREPSWPLAEGDVDNPKDWIWRTPEAECEKFADAQAAGYPVMIGEFGCYNRISHKTALAWMEHCLKLWRDKELGWALWNLDGPFGFLDSGRTDVDYEEFHGHQLDRGMLSLLQKYIRSADDVVVTPENNGRALTGPVDSPRDRVMRRLREVAETDSYYWAWTHCWVDVFKWSGDPSHAVKKADGTMAPKPVKDVRLTSVYQRYSGGKRPLIAYTDMAGIVGTWHSPQYYETNRASLTAAIRRYWREFGGVMVFSWHMDQPYCTNGFRAASYRFKSSGENRNVIRQILDGTGGPCGTDTLERKNHRPPCANPKEWYMRQLKDVVTFLKGLVDEETGERIPVILRYGHECDGDWFWWGRTWCTADEFRRFSRMTADYLRKECGEDQILFAYTPDCTWKEFGKEGDANNTFLAYYPGNAYVDILGLDDYSIGNGDDRKVESNFNETVRKLRLMTEFARERGKVVCISEAGGNHKRDDFWQWLYRAATADGVKVAFVDTWSGEWGTLPATPASEADEIAFARRPETLMEDSGKGFREIHANEKSVIKCPAVTHKVFPGVERGQNERVRSRTLKVNESAVSDDDPSIADSGGGNPKAQTR